MQARSALRPALLLATAAIGGCFSTLVTLDDLGSGDAVNDAGAETGADAGANADANADVIPETGADVDPVDGSDSSDAADGADTPEAAQDAFDAPEAADAAVEVEAETDADGRWCDQNGMGALFCDDFDGALVWDEEIVSPAAQLQVTTSDAQSPPRSLEFHSNAFTQGGQGEAYRVKNVAATSAALAFSYAFFLDTVPSSQGATIPTQLILRDGNGVTLRLSILVTAPYAMKLETERQASGQTTQYKDYSFAVQAAQHQWVTVSYQVTASVPRKLDVMIDGQLALEGLALDDLQGLEVTPSIWVGACYVEAPTDPWTLRFDNVLLR